MPTATRVTVSPRLSSSPRPPVTQSQVSLAHFEDTRLNVPSTAFRHLPPRKDVIRCLSTLQTSHSGPFLLEFNSPCHLCTQTPSTGIRHRSFLCRKAMLGVRSAHKIQAVVYDSLLSATAVFSYSIGFRKLSANEQFCCWCSNSSKFVTNNSNYIRHIDPFSFFLSVRPHY